MTYRAIALNYAPGIKKMSSAVEEKATELSAQGWRLSAFSVTGSAKAVLVFCAQDAVFREAVGALQYRAITIGYVPDAKKLAAVVEEKSNEMADQGWRLSAFSVTGSAKAVLVFCAQSAAYSAPAAEETKPA